MPLFFPYPPPLLKTAGKVLHSRCESEHATLLRILPMLFSLTQSNSPIVTVTCKVLPGLTTALSDLISFPLPIDLSIPVMLESLLFLVNDQRSCLKTYVSFFFAWKFFLRISAWLVHSPPLGPFSHIYSMTYSWIILSKIAVPAFSQCYFPVFAFSTSDKLNKEFICLWSCLFH